MDAVEYRNEVDKVRVWLAKQMGLEEVPDEVWGHVEKLDLVYTAIVIGNDESWRELLEEAKDRRRESLEATGQKLPPGRGTSGEGGRVVHSVVEVELSEDTRRRADAFAEVAANMACAHPSILRFRRQFIPEGLLTDAEARRFLDVRVKPYTEPNKKIGGVRQEMLKLAKKLSEAYGWREEDAIWFVLTGHSPQARPVEVDVYVKNTPTLPDRSKKPPSGSPGPVYRDTSPPNRAYRPSMARIVVSVDVWVDADEVTRTVRKVQRNMLGGDARSSRKPRNLAAVVFVARRMREHPEETWKERLRAWNNAYPDWRYQDFRTLRQAFERFAYREYHLPRDEPPHDNRESDWLRVQI